jgi:RNA polymerase sigma-70 factor (ECF subfamily)
VSTAAEVRQFQQDNRFEQYRVELTGYCYRMLGSGFDADDAVQETLLRAWKSFDGFEGRSAVKSWLYRIATNVCLNMLEGRQRRARPMDLTEPSSADVPVGRSLPESVWVQPVPDGRVLPTVGDPAELAVSRESIGLAFVAALQHLPPRQRAVLILRDVLRWKATEVASLLDTTVVSVNSALQRARATLSASDLTATDSLTDMDPAKRELLVRYVDAFERYDIESLISLLHEEATFSMPPLLLWLQGRSEIRQFYFGQGLHCRGSRAVPITANGGPAFGIYEPGGRDGGHQAFAIQSIEVTEGRISAIHSFLDPNLFPLFDLPLRLN